MPAEDGGEFTAIEANTEPALQQSCCLRRHQNFMASPLLRLPSELILKIFEHAIEPDDDGDNDNNSDDGSSPTPSDNYLVLLALIAICHKLRKVGITTPHL
jgi:hypothetical protein